MICSPSSSPSSPTIYSRRSSTDPARAGRAQSIDQCPRRHGDGRHPERRYGQRSARPAGLSGGTAVRGKPFVDTELHEKVRRLGPAGAGQGYRAPAAVLSPGARKLAQGDADTRRRWRGGSSRVPGTNQQIPRYQLPSALCGARTMAEALGWQGWVVCSRRSHEIVPQCSTSGCAFSLRAGR
jgi:hypothetical protein